MGTCGVVTRLPSVPSSCTTPPVAIELLCDELVVDPPDASVIVVVMGYVPSPLDVTVTVFVDVDPLELVIVVVVLPTATNPNSPIFGSVDPFSLVVSLLLPLSAPGFLLQPVAP